MFNRENAIGIIFVGICAAVAAVMLYYIGIGERPRLNLGTAGTLAVGALFFGLLIFGAIRGGIFGRIRRGQRGPQWPDPNTGRKSWWDRLRGK